jgi:large conductance mechanosensitive channel
VSGFRNFILRGNLVELAVAFILATAFAAVVTATVGMIMDLIGKIGGTPDFSDYEPGGVSVGEFLTTLIAFLIISAVVYFFIVAPYTRAQERFFPKEEPGTPDDIALLEEIRDLLANPATKGTSPPL